jgi:hypothetical protein
LDFTSAVPHGEIVCHTRIQADFCNAEEQAAEEQTMVILHNAHKCYHGAPGDHDGREHMEGRNLFNRRLEGTSNKK